MYISLKHVKNKSQEGIQYNTNKGLKKFTSIGSLYKVD